MLLKTCYNRMKFLACRSTAIAGLNVSSHWRKKSQFDIFDSRRELSQNAWQNKLRPMFSIIRINFIFFHPASKDLANNKEIARRERFSFNWIMRSSVIYFYQTSIMCRWRWISGEWYQHNFIIVLHFSDPLSGERENRAIFHGVERCLCLLLATGLINIFTLNFFSTCV